MCKIIHIIVFVIKSKIENENKKKERNGNYKKIVIGGLFEWWRKLRKEKNAGSLMQMKEVEGKKFEKLKVEERRKKEDRRRTVEETGEGSHCKSENPN